MSHKRYLDTMYSLRALPIGGYAAMEGEDEASDVEGSFDSVSPFKRILVVAAETTDRKSVV